PRMRRGGLRTSGGAGGACGGDEAEPRSEPSHCRPRTAHSTAPATASSAGDNACMPALRPPAIALMGPTASGKTALALEWAGRHGGEIVSVDSALVYRGLDIGAAKPDAAERARVPHHLLDLRQPWQAYSAAEFARDARAAIED